MAKVKERNKQIALSAIHQIQAELREQRRTKRMGRPVLSPEELLIRRSLADFTRLVRAIEDLSKALVACRDHFDPFSPEYEQAQQALKKAQSTVISARANWVRLPARLRKGVEGESDTTSVGTQMDRTEG
jgi:hypothetical protein